MTINDDKKISIIFYIDNSDVWLRFTTLISLQLFKSIWEISYLHKKRNIAVLSYAYP